MIASLSEKEVKQLNTGMIPDLVTRSDPHLQGGELGGQGGSGVLCDIKFLGPPGGYSTESASTTQDSYLLLATK